MPDGWCEIVPQPHAADRHASLRDVPSLSASSRGRTLEALLTSWAIEGPGLRSRRMRLSARFALPGARSPTTVRSVARTPVPATVAVKLARVSGRSTLCPAFGIGLFRAGRAIVHDRIDRNELRFDMNGECLARSTRSSRPRLRHCSNGNVGCATSTLSICVARDQFAALGAGGIATLRSLSHRVVGWGGGL